MQTIHYEEELTQVATGLRTTPKVCTKLWPWDNTVKPTSQVSQPSLLTLGVCWTTYFVSFSKARPRDTVIGTTCTNYPTLPFGMLLNPVAVKCSHFPAFTHTRLSIVLEEICDRNRNILQDFQVSGLLLVEKFCCRKEVHQRQYSQLYTIAQAHSCALKIPACLPNSSQSKQHTLNCFF